MIFIRHQSILSKVCSCWASQALELRSNGYYLTTLLQLPCLCSVCIAEKMCYLLFVILSYSPNIYLKVLRKSSIITAGLEAQIRVECFPSMKQEFGSNPSSNTEVLNSLNISSWRLRCIFSCDSNFCLLLPEQETEMYRCKKTHHTVCADAENALCSQTGH
jgi:hypothetical protein